MSKPYKIMVEAWDGIDIHTALQIAHGTPIPEDCRFPPKITIGHIVRGFKVFHHTTKTGIEVFQVCRLAAAHPEGKETE